MEVSPLLASDTAGSIAAAARIHRQAARDNLFVKIPGTPEGVPAIEESIFDGVPINVTLLFSREQYLAAAEAYLRGIERRIAAGRDPAVASVASLFVSRWDKAVADKVPADLRNRPRHRDRRSAPTAPIASCWHRRAGSALAAAGARPQRLLWASTGTKDPAAPDTLYVEALAAPDTIDTMPEKTLRAFADHGELHGADARRTAATATPCWRSSRRPASTSMRWRRSCSRKAPRRSSSRGTQLLQRIADKTQRWPGRRSDGNAAHERCIGPQHPSR